MQLRKTLLENKWWWIVPILLVLALVGFILFRTGTGEAPEGDPSSPFQYDLY